MVLHPDHAQNTVPENLNEELSRLNDRLPAYKRVTGYILWHDDFPRTASLKIKRNVLAGQIANQLNRAAAVPL